MEVLTLILEFMGFILEHLEYHPGAMEVPSEAMEAPPGVVRAHPGAMEIHFVVVGTQSAGKEFCPAATKAGVVGTHLGAKVSP